MVHHVKHRLHVELVKEGKKAETEPSSPRSTSDNSCVTSNSVLDPNQHGTVMCSVHKERYTFVFNLSFQLTKRRDCADGYEVPGSKRHGRSIHDMRFIEQ